MRGWVAMIYKNPVPGLPEDMPSIKEKQEHSISQNGYPMHNNIYFAFIDVLGFQQTFDEHRKDPTKQFAKDYEDVFSYFGKLLQHARFMQHGHAPISQAGQTSDSLYFYTDRPDYLDLFTFQPLRNESKCLFPRWHCKRMPICQQTVPVLWRLCNQSVPLGGENS